MRGFSKLNRGLILTAAIVIAVVIYVITVTVSQSAAKPDIKKVCQNYIRTYVSYSMLPDNYRTVKPSVPKDKLDSYINEMTDAIGAYYPDGSTQRKYAVKDVKESLKKQALGTGVITNYKKEISKINSYSFDGDTVTVTVTCNTSITMAGASATSAQITDTLTLQKTNGVWKVVYAYIQGPAVSDKFDALNLK